MHSGRHGKLKKVDRIDFHYFAHERAVLHDGGRGV